MNRELRIVSLLIAAAGMASCGPNRPMAEAPQRRHAQLELLADPATLSNAGVPRWLGVHFKLDPGWHIYWRNPGDSGQPPVVNWRSPEKITALPIQWPRPERLNSTGGSLMDYGYKDDVLLLIPVSVPENSSRLDLAAEVKYLICREVCIPENADLHLASPAANDARTAELFTRARNQLPKILPQGWKATATDSKGDFVLSIKRSSAADSGCGTGWDTDRPLTADFFPLEPLQIENAAPQILRTTSCSATITLKKSDQLAKSVTMLRGVLSLGDGEAYRIEAPVARR